MGYLPPGIPKETEGVTDNAPGFMWGLKRAVEVGPGGNCQLLSVSSDMELSADPNRHQPSTASSRAAPPPALPSAPSLRAHRLDPRAPRWHPVPVVTFTFHGVADCSLLRSALLTFCYVPYILWHLLAWGSGARGWGRHVLLFILQTAPPFARDCSANSRLSREDRFKRPVNTHFPIRNQRSALKSLADIPGSVLLTQYSPVRPQIPSRRLRIRSTHAIFARTRPAISWAYFQNVFPLPILQHYSRRIRPGALALHRRRLRGVLPERHTPAACHNEPPPTRYSDRPQRTLAAVTVIVEAVWRHVERKGSNVHVFIAIPLDESADFVRLSTVLIISAQIQTCIWMHSCHGDRAHLTLAIGGK
ncbi:hypothetical protein B0H17DRAFT_1142249 [Mycena rosella]|uniref:Uncharacterized protein n=1 Tax=Mycena rosella TaxID=1033263 RepID=A0AAD7G996_MYCRO|nr:hypothetical protein B0H17DRAFT_1142249 [Mycena rosella]